MPIIVTILLLAGFIVLTELNRRGSSCSLLPKPVPEPSITLYGDWQGAPGLGFFLKAEIVFDADTDKLVVIRAEWVTELGDADPAEEEAVRELVSKRLIFRKNNDDRQAN